MISLEPVRVAPWLLDAEIPFVRQANIDPAQLQAEGWGIAWYPPEGRLPRVRKGAEAVYRPAERERFTEVASGLTCPLVIAHLRKASNPMALPREKLVAMENSQPFVSEGSVFAHNGWIALPRETQRRLGNRASLLRGVNDSEVFQQLFLTRLDRSEDPVRAYADAMRDLHEVWEEEGRPGNGPHGGLNILLSRNSEELWAFCHYTGEHGSCLSGLPRPYYEMSYFALPGSVVVTSEPMDRHLEKWKPLRSAEYLRIRRSGGELEVFQAEIPGLPRFPALPKIARPDETKVPLAAE